MTDRVPGGTRSREGRCPVCERFIGPATRCPFCGEDAPPPNLLRWLRRMAVLVALLGLASLYLAVTHRELPLVTVAEMNPMMNFAYVRVAGRVARSPMLRFESGHARYLSFLLDDGTGTLRVQVRDEVADALVTTEAVPKAGSMVEASGSLDLAANREPRMRVHAPEQIRVVADARLARAGGTQP